MAADNDQERLEKVDADLAELDKKIKPLERKRSLLYKTRGKIVESINNSYADDFEYMVRTQSCWKQLRDYCVAFQEAPHDYFGATPGGFNIEANCWVFDLKLREEGAIEAAKKWIDTHLPRLSPAEYRGHDHPLVSFGYLSEESGLKWLCWEPAGDRWLDVEFVYGRIRRVQPVDSLDAGLEHARGLTLAEDPY